MAATVELRAGDMFEGPSDLIVLPCSVVPTVTGFVRRRLEQFSIPKPTSAMQLGDVHFVQLHDGQQLASWAAFAASVERTKTSSLEAIERIGRRLGEYAKENESVQAIAAPLLGTGAGGLGVEDAAQRLSSGFLAAAPERGQLRLYALEDDEYKRLSKFFRTGEGAGDYVADHKANVEYVQRRVFLSYTASSDKHKAWVRDFAEWLRENGVNARLDQWHLRRGMDVAQWMCNELDQADRVLLLCDERYAQKADGRHGGVGWEIRIIQGDLLTRPDGTTTVKYLPVVRSDEVAEGTPAFLKSVYCFHWPPGGDDKNHRTELLKAIYDVEEKAPEVGLPPLFIREALRKSQGV